MNYQDPTIADATDAQESRFRELGAVLLRNKWLLLATTLGTILLAVLVTLQSPPNYEGTTTVLINSKAGQQANPFAQGVEPAVGKLANEMAILKARGLARKVALDLLAEPYLDSSRSETLPVLRRDRRHSSADNLAGADSVTDRLQNVVAFVPERESDVIRIVASSPDPREAARVANAFADMYVNQVMQQSRSRSRSVREFLEGRLTDQRSQLQHAEGALKNFMESTGLVSLDAESNRLVQELSQLEATRNSLSIEIEGLNKKVGSLQAELPQQEASAANMIGQANDPYIRLLSEQLARLEVQRDVTLAQNDPAILNQGVNQAKLKELGDQIDALRENLRQRTAELMRDPSGIGSAGTQADPLNYIRGLRQQLLESKIQLETLRSRRSALQDIINGYEGKFQKIPRHSLELARVQRERLSTEKLYGLVEEKFNEAAITEKSEFGYVDIIDRATAEGSKGRSSLVWNTVLGLLIGLGLSLSVAFIREAVDVRVRTPEQLVRLGFPCLSEIAKLDAELGSLEFNGSIPEEAAAFSPHVKLIFHPLSFTAESYRRLRTSLMRQQSLHPMKTLLVTSANPQEGKSTTIANLAVSLAETQQRILVIDADLRRPTIHTLLGLSPSPGLTDIVTGSLTLNSVVHRNVVYNLDVLTCGTSVKNPSRLIGLSQSLKKIIGAQNHYDWVLLDAPPVLVVNDALDLASILDGAIIIVNSGVTRLDALKRATTVLKDAGGKVVGVVMNRFDPKAAYGMYYGSHRYGHYDNRHSYYGAKEA